MSVTLTENAASEIKRVMQEQNRPELKYVRVGVVGGGCSGFQYAFDFTNSYDETTDLISEHHGVGVVVDKKSDLFLDGTTIDFDARHTFSDEQVEWFRAGSALNIVRAKVAQGDA